MSLPTKLEVYNQDKNLNKIVKDMSYGDRGNIYGKLNNNKNEIIALNIKNGNNNEASNNLEFHKITKERENIVNNINNKIKVQKSVYQRPNNNNIYYDNTKDHSYPLSDNSRNQMYSNSEYLYKINQNYYIPRNEPNFQTEKKTEINEMTQPPMNTEVPIAEIKHIEIKYHKKCCCNCKRVCMVITKIIIALPLFALILAGCALLGSASGGNGGGGGGGVAVGDVGAPSGSGLCCCCINLIKWIISDTWSCKKK